MREYVMILIEKLPSLALPATIFLSVSILGYIIRKIIFIQLINWARNTKTEIDDIIISSARTPFMIWFFMLGLYFAIESSQLPERLAHIIGKSLLILGIFSITLVLANIIARCVKTYSNKINSTMPVASLTQNVSRIIIFCVGFLIVLNSLGISITPILATLGVGGLAVALALQDTLSNFFAGFHIIAAGQIRIGDYVKLESEEEGYVIDINWRTTKIKMLPNNVILVPNEKLAKTIVTNYYLPEKEMAVPVDLGVHYKSDLKKVEKVTCRTADEVMKTVAGGVPEFKPFIRYHTFDDSGIRFTVILRAREFVDQYLIKHEFVKRLHEEYSKEGIVIPYPIRAINYEQEGEKIK